MAKPSLINKFNKRLWEGVVVKFLDPWDNAMMLSVSKSVRRVILSQRGVDAYASCVACDIICNRTAYKRVSCREGLTVLLCFYCRITFTSECYNTRCGKHRLIYHMRPVVEDIPELTYVVQHACCAVERCITNVEESERENKYGTGNTFRPNLQYHLQCIKNLFGSIPPAHTMNSIYTAKSESKNEPPELSASEERAMLITEMKRYIQRIYVDQTYSGLSDLFS